MTSSHVLKWLRTYGVGLLGVVAILTILYPATTRAADTNDFSIQVSPSPLVVTLTPGKAQTANVTVRNFSNHPETITASLKGFHVDADSRQVSLTADAPAGMGNWVTFAASSLT